MTSGLASDSDKFKIITTLCRAQKFRDTRPYKNLFFLKKKPWTTWPEGASAPSCTVKVRGHEVPEMVRPASRTTAVLLDFPLDKYSMFSFAMTSGLASDSDKFGIVTTLRRAQKFGDTRPCENLFFSEKNDLNQVIRRCFGTKWYGEVPGARSTRDGDTGKKDDSSLAGFLNLTKMICSVLR